MKRVKASWVILLPENAVLKVKTGDVVKYNQVLFEDVVESEKIVSYQPQLKGLSLIEIEEINKNNQDKELRKDDVLYQGKGWFPKKIVISDDGVFKGIDELLNIHLVTSREKQKVTSPTEAKVGDIKNGEMVLEFMAEEYLGTGLNAIRDWVSNGVRLIKNIAEINTECKGGLLLVDNVTEAILIKAEVVGVRGLIVLDDVNLVENVRINFKTPVLLVTRDVYEELKLRVSVDTRALVNGGSGRLLLVVS